MFEFSYADEDHKITCPTLRALIDEINSEEEFDVMKESVLVQRSNGLPYAVIEPARHDLLGYINVV